MVIFSVIKIYYTQRTHHLFSFVFVFVCVKKKKRQTKIFSNLCGGGFIVVYYGRKKIIIIKETKTKKDSRKKTTTFEFRKKRIFPEPNFQNKTGKKKIYHLISMEFSKISKKKTTMMMMIERTQIISIIFLGNSTNQPKVSLSLSITLSLRYENVCIQVICISVFGLLCFVFWYAKHTNKLGGLISKKKVVCLRAWYQYGWWKFKKFKVKSSSILINHRWWWLVVFFCEKKKFSI